MADTGGMYVCGDCKRGYTRLDHLARHVRSHTQEKPYACKVCPKRFGRADLLKRHAEAHTQSASDEQSRKKRQRNGGDVAVSRVGQACEACVKAHLRCQDTKPCDRCVKKRLLCRVTSAQPGEGVSANEEQPSSSVALFQPAGDRSEHIEDAGFENEMLHVDASLALDSTLLASPTAPTPMIEQHQNIMAINNDPGAPPDSPRDFAMPTLTDFGIADNMFAGFNFTSGTITPRGPLDFGLQSSLELTDMDLSFLDNYNIQAPFDFQTPVTLPPSEQADHNPAEGDIAARAEAYRVSTWRFRPRREDNAPAQQQHLALSKAEAESPEPRVKLDKRSTTERLQHSSRDKIMALILSTCNTANVPRIVQAFPSVELLDNLLQFYLTSPVARTWIHLPTVSPIASKAPELLTAMIAAGAVITPDASLRKLGFALQEALRVFIPTRWEADNSQTRNLELVQAFALQLYVGMWSGNSRKMEMAESFLQPLVTMLRRSGRFRSSMYTFVAPSAEDDANATDQKWRSWVEQESYIRLVLWLYRHDAHASMALLTTPLISYAELALPLPDAKQLWEAPSASAWSRLWLSRPSASTRRPTLSDCVDNISTMSINKNYFDTDRANFAYLHAQWGLVWEYRQLSSILRTQSHQALLLASRHQELVKSLNFFRLSYSSTHEQSTTRLSVTLELVLMHLHMSLEDIQLFAGLEGPQEAARVYPALQEWIKTGSSRQAILHAGQIFRAARDFQRGGLRDFHAIALYHASLAFWAYGIIRRNSRENLATAPETSVPVWLDGAIDSSDMQRYLGLNVGSPVILGKPEAGERRAIEVTDPAAVLQVVIEILRANHDIALGSRPDLVENLIQLTLALQRAAKGAQEGAS